MAKNSLNRRNFLKLSGMLGMGIAAPAMLELVEYRQAQAAQGKTLNAAMSSAGLAGTWNAEGKKAAEYFGKLLGVNITWFDGEFDPSKQRAKFDQLSTQKWDFVAVQPNSIGTLKEPIQALAKANIPVIDMDTLVVPLQELYDLGVLTFIAPNNVFMAESVTSKLVEKMGGKGKIAHIWGQQGHTGAQARAQGFKNYLKKFPDIKVVAEEFGDWDVAKVAGLTQAILNKNNDLTGLYAHNDDMALAARKVIEDAGLGKQVFVAGIDAMQPAMQAVKDGKLVATARNSTTRIHGWAVFAGAFAASAGIDKARKSIPKFVLADGPAIYGDIDNNPELAKEPWKLNNYGMSPVDGLIWAADQFLF
jgi:ribose transport system substrate-binding protein